jgi:hypothetical protein
VIWGSRDQRKPHVHQRQRHGRSPGLEVFLGRKAAVDRLLERHAIRGGAQERVELHLVRRLRVAACCSEWGGSARTTTAPRLFRMTAPLHYAPNIHNLSVVGMERVPRWCCVLGRAGARTRAASTCESWRGQRGGGQTHAYAHLRLQQLHYGSAVRCLHLLCTWRQEPWNVTTTSDAGGPAAKMAMCCSRHKVWQSALRHVMCPLFASKSVAV